MGRGGPLERSLHGLLDSIETAQARYCHVADADRPPMTVLLLGAVTATHLIHARQLVRAMRRVGLCAARPGSRWPSAPDQSATDLRPLATADVARSICTEEALVIEAYDRAIDAVGQLDGTLATVLHRQRAEVLSQLRDVRDSLRDPKADDVRNAREGRLYGGYHRQGTGQCEPSH